MVVLLTTGEQEMDVLLMVTVKSSIPCSVMASLLGFICARMDFTESESQLCLGQDLT